jgi:hypothetical protein
MGFRRPEITLGKTVHRAQQVPAGGYLGCTGRAANVIVTAALDRCRPSSKRRVARAGAANFDPGGFFNQLIRPCPIGRKADLCSASRGRSRPPPDD